MKARRFSILTLLMVSALFIQNTFAQNYTQWHLPEGAKARIGKGFISGNIAFSPDSNLLAVPTSIGIWIYDAYKREEVRLVTGYTDTVECIAFSPDGSLLASGSDDDTVHLWDINTRTHKILFTGRTSSVRSIAFSPDSRTLAGGSRSNRDKTVYLWDIDTGNLKATLSEHTNGVDSIAFSPDGKTIASLSDAIVYLWDASNNDLKNTFTRDINNDHIDDVNLITFSPNGETIATANWDDTVSLWDVATAELSATLTGHTASVYSVAFSPDGKTLASGSSDGTVCLWDVASGTYKTTLIGHALEVRSVAFSPDGKLIASSSSDGTVCFWDAVSHDRTATLTGHITEFTSIAFSPGGRTLAHAGGWDKKVYLWDVETANQKGALIGHTYEVTSVAFSPDGKTVASGGGVDDPTIRLWDPNSGELKMILVGHLWGGINDLVFSHDSRWIASAGRDQKVCLWKTDTGYHQATFVGPTAAISKVALSPNGQILASTGGQQDPAVRLWDISSRKEIATLRGRSNCIAFSPDGQTLASGWIDISLWDIRSGELKSEFSGHTDGLRSVAFSPDGRILASGSSDTTVRLWDVETATHLTTLTGHTNGITHIAFSPDGKTLATASDDATALLWDIPLIVENGIKSLQIVEKVNPNGIVDPARALAAEIFEAEKAAIQEVYSRFYKAFNELDFEKIAETMDTSSAAMFGTVFSKSEPLSVVIGWNNVRVFIEGLWRGVGTRGEKWGPNDKLTDVWIRQTEASARGYNCYKGPYPGETYLYLVKKNDGWRIQQIESVTQDNLPIFKDKPRIRNYFTVPENKAQNIDEPAISQRREDLNNDGAVNIQDLVIVSANFGKRGQTVADVNGDGIVDIRDLVLIAGAINHEQ